MEALIIIGLLAIFAPWILPLILNVRRKEEIETLRERLGKATERIYELEQRVKDLIRAQRAEARRAPAIPPVSESFAAPAAPAAAVVRQDLRSDESAAAPPPVIPEPVSWYTRSSAPARESPLAAEPQPVVTAAPAQSPPAPPVVEPAAAPLVSPSFAAAEGAPARREDLETRFGTRWLNRIGATILVLGIALFLSYAFTELGPWGKICLAYAVAVAMTVGGWLLEKRERYRLYGHALLASGWALTYFTTYALHNVAAVRVVQSEAADLILLFVVAAGIIAQSLHYRSQAVTGFAYLLAYLTVAISHVTFYSLGALAVLTISMGVVLWKENWFEMELIGIISIYACHLSWVSPFMRESGHLPKAEFFASVAWLAAYWLTFNFVHLGRRPLNALQERVSYATLLANAFLFLGLMRYQARHSGWAFWALLAAGIVYLLFSAAAQHLARRTSFVLLATLGVALIFAAVPLRFTGARLSGLWLIDAEILLVAGFLLREIHFRRLAWLAMAITSCYLLFNDWTEVAFGGQSPREGSAVLFALAAALAYANPYWLSRRFAAALIEQESIAHRCYSYLAGLFLTLAIWRVLPAVWLAPAWAVVMIVLMETGALHDIVDLRRQARVLSLLVLAWCWVRDLVHFQPGATWLGVSLRWPTAGVAAAAFYAVHLRWRTRPLHEWGFVRDDYRPFVSYFSYAATLVVVLLLGLEAPDRHLGLIYLALVLVLAELGAWIGDGALRLPAYAVLVPAVVCVSWFNLSLAQLRLPATSVFIAGLLWLIFRIRTWVAKGKAAENEAVVSAAATYVAAGLSAWLVFAEAHGLWVAPALGVLALAFAAPGLLQNLRHFRYAAGMIHGVALGTALVRNLPVAGRNWWLTERAWTVLSLVALTYLLSYWLFRWAQSAGAARELERRASIVQCWLGTGLLSLLAWYDMRPAAVAVAWGFLAVGFTEIGGAFHSSHWRWQGYLLSAAAFARIFFSNLDASTPVAGLSARLWTVGLLAIFFYYQFLRLRADRDQQLLGARETVVPEAYSYLGLASLAALLRFELTRPWVAVAWALLSAAVLALGIRRSDRQFRLQAYILGVIVAVRTSLNNFYLIETYAGSSARLVTVGSITTILFGCFAAIHWARAAQVTTSETPANRLSAALLWIDRHSRYIYFFAPTGLLTTLLVLEVSSGLLTLAWGLEGLALFLCGLAIGERPFRLSGLLLLLVCIGRIFVFDLRGSNLLYRIASFLVLGAVLLIVSFLYTRYRDKLNRYL